MVMDHTARWQNTDPGDGYPPDVNRRHDDTLAYPGANPHSPRSGISPSGGNIATLTGFTIDYRAGLGVIAPTASPWTPDSGGYTVQWPAGQITIPPAHATLTRVDLLVARLLDDPIDGSGDRRATVMLVNGTPGSGAPAMGVSDVLLATYTTPGGGTPSQSLAHQYIAALGGILVVPTEAGLPASPHDGQAAYVEDEQAVRVAQGSVWRAIGTRRGYQWGGTVKFTATGSFVKADYPGLRAIRVKCQGGGGGGGGATANAANEGSSGGGGGGGCYAEAVILASSLGSSTTATVGAGGAVTAGATGGAGGASSFGGYISAPGGGGGFNRSASTGHAASSGAATSADATITGHVAGTDLVVRGGGGGSGYTFGSSVISAATEDKGAYGQGGSAYLGGSGRGARGPSTSPAAGSAYGGGGSGAVNGWTASAGEAAKAGGAGAAGVVIVELLY